VAVFRLVGQAAPAGKVPPHATPKASGKPASKAASAPPAARRAPAPAAATATAAADADWQTF
jgi:hypothetical protein